MPKFALLPNCATALHRKPAVGFTAGMNAVVATVVTKARLGFHTGRSGMMNRRSNEGVGQGSSWGTLSSCPHEFIFEFAFNLNVFLTALYLKVMRM